MELPDRLIAMHNACDGPKLPPKGKKESRENGVGTSHERGKQPHYEDYVEENDEKYLSKEEDDFGQSTRWIPSSPLKVRMSPSKRINKRRTETQSPSPRKGKLEHHKRRKEFLKDTVWFNYNSANSTDAEDESLAIHLENNPLPKRLDYVHYAKRHSQHGIHHSKLPNLVGSSMKLSSEVKGSHVNPNNSSIGLFSEISIDQSLVDDSHNSSNIFGTFMPTSEFPNYNASNFSTTYKGKQEKRNNFMLTSSPVISSDALLGESSDILLESSESQAGSDVPEIQPENDNHNDEDNKEEHELGSEMSIEEYIKNENSTFIMDNAQDGQSDYSDSNVTVNDLDKTPVFTRKTNKTNILQSRFKQQNWNNEASSEDDFDFKLDSFGRISNEGNLLGNMTTSDELSPDETEKNWLKSSLPSKNSSLRQSSTNSETRSSKRILRKNHLKSSSFNTFRTKKRTSSAHSFRSSSMNDSTPKTAARSLSGTNSSIEDMSIKSAKNCISNAIDEGNPVIELEKLNLRYIPDEIEDLSNLICLDQLSHRIYQPEIKIYLSNNRLGTINPRIFNIKNLSVLSLRNNKISAIPGKIKHCTSLTYLQLAGNKIRYLPVEFLALSNIQMLSVRPNNELIEFKTYAKTHKVKKVLQPVDTKDTQFVKRFVGELELNKKTCANNKLRLPKLSELCLRKLENYDLSSQEIKTWSQHLSRSHLKLISQSLIKLMDGNTCYNCHKSIVNEPTGSIIEFHDICEMPLVPIRKEFCCSKCMDNFAKSELASGSLVDYELDTVTNENHAITVGSISGNANPEGNLPSRLSLNEDF